MNQRKLFLMPFMIIIAITALQCTDDIADEYNEVLQKSGKVEPALKTTGSLQILWKGGGQNKETDGQPDLKQAFFQFDAHEGVSNRLLKGEIVYQVFNEDLTVHREIKAKVQDVLIDPEEKKAGFTGIVYYDSKSLEDSHDDHEEGGCTHEDGEECTHDDVDDESGGCDGGCTDDEGGCSHDDGEESEGGCTHDDEESCEGGGEGGSGKVSGKNSRVGQLIAVKVHDGGTPGANNDGITWRWFSSSDSFVPSTDNIYDWPHLCKKTILEGNLIVHVK